MEIYELNLDSIKYKENLKNNKNKRKVIFIYDEVEKDFLDKNYNLTLKAREYLKDKKDVVMKYDDNFYKFKKSSIKNGNSSDYCKDCDFKSKCHHKLQICITEALFESETDINLKKIEEYEAIFGE